MKLLEFFEGVIKTQQYLPQIFAGVSDAACLKIFKIPYYGFTMMSLDLTLSHTCISYVSAKFLGKDLLGQCIFFISKVL